MLDQGKPGISGFGYCSGSAEGNKPLRQIGPLPADSALLPGSELPSVGERMLRVAPDHGESSFADAFLPTSLIAASSFSS